MIVADTHALLWWFHGDKRLSPAARERLLGEDLVIVPAVVWWEIALLLSKKRITVSKEPLEFLRAVADVPSVREWPLTQEIAVCASQLGDAFHRDPSDRLIVATAIELGAPLVTADARIHAYGGVESLW